MNLTKKISFRAITENISKICVFSPVTQKRDKSEFALASFANEFSGRETIAGNICKNVFFFFNYPRKWVES